MKSKFLLIPEEIVERKDLTPLDKLLVGKIIGLDNDKHCYASNEALANMIGVSKASISSSINKMLKMGILTLIKFDGRRREISCNYTSTSSKTRTVATGLFDTF
jgi:DNA-binding transcriptional regulator GbsR (MarR family)